MLKNKNQKMIDNEAIKLFRNIKLKNSIIIILFKEKKVPKYCTPMLRVPKPRVNISLNNNLEKIYYSNVKKNPSIKDGAILIEMGHNSPILRGFSYRIYPPSTNATKKENLGSGYNSSLDFSCVKRVECVYFIKKNGIKKFVNGKEKTLC